GRRWQAMDTRGTLRRTRIWIVAVPAVMLVALVVAGPGSPNGAWAGMGTLTLKKVLVQDDGGTRSVTDWTLAARGAGGSTTVPNGLSGTSGIQAEVND